MHGEFLIPIHCYDFASLFTMGAMRDLAVLFLHLLVTVARLAGSGGTRAVVAESVLVKQQLGSSIGPGNGRPTSASLIASSPACSRCSCARGGWSVPPSF